MPVLLLVGKPHELKTDLRVLRVGEYQLCHGSLHRHVVLLKGGHVLLQEQLLTRVAFAPLQARGGHVQHGGLARHAGAVLAGHKRQHYQPLVVGALFCFLAALRDFASPLVLGAGEARSGHGVGHVRDPAVRAGAVRGSSVPTAVLLGVPPLGDGGTGGHKNHLQLALAGVEFLALIPQAELLATGAEHRQGHPTGHPGGKLVRAGGLYALQVGGQIGVAGDQIVHDATPLCVVVLRGTPDAVLAVHALAAHHLTADATEIAGGAGLGCLVLFL